MLYADMCEHCNVFVNFSKDRLHHEKKFQLGNCFKFIKIKMWLCMKNVLWLWDMQLASCKQCTCIQLQDSVVLGKYL